MLPKKPELPRKIAHMPQDGAKYRVVLECCLQESRIYLVKLHIGPRGRAKYRVIPAFLSTRISRLVPKKAGKPESRIYLVFSHILGGGLVLPKKPDLPRKIAHMPLYGAKYTVIPAFVSTRISRLLSKKAGKPDLPRVFAHFRGMGVAFKKAGITS